MSEKKLISIHELDEFVEIDESLKGVIEDAKKVLEMSDDELSAEMERIKQRNAERLKNCPIKPMVTNLSAF